ncbi:high choriolytic enzyme 1-like [Porites lutea]|uniref:high choriolytic enzyme 1-like n=1 Tax=Porites lutea TaxID=51062 RepID=UPI003CC5ADFB
MSAIRAGMAEWTTKTCIRFRRRTNEPSYVLFRTGRGCSSQVGRTGRQQQITLAPGCWFRGIVAHEIGHALGFFHEQSRPDRDSFVRILTQNIQPGRENNFNKYTTGIIDSLGSPYDYGSVMHYRANAFSKNGRPTIQVLQPGQTIGQRNGLSPIDASQANKLYQSLCAAPIATATPVPTATPPDINECLSSPCHPNAVCQNTIGSFTCTCRSGFTGNGRFCRDTNECLSSPCHSNAVCQNTIGSFTCTCRSGFTGNGRFCRVAACRDSSFCRLFSVSLRNCRTRWWVRSLCKRTCNTC